jgi:hypothetical protein
MSRSPSPNDNFLDESSAALDEGWLLDDGELPELGQSPKTDPRRKPASRRSIEEYWERKRLRRMLEDVYGEDDPDLET